MLSRVASSIYWMSRYVERAENLARFIDVTLHVILDQPLGSGEQWEPLVRTTGDGEYFAKHYGTFTSEHVRQFLTFDSEYHSSILTSVSVARENARTVREAISSESWEQLNTFYWFVKAASQKGLLSANSEFYNEIKQHAHLFNGILDSTISRGPGWHFANLGRALERADKTSRILDVKYFTLLPRIDDIGTTRDDLLWSAVLRSVSGFEMFRKRYHALTIHRVVDFLVLDKYFPRAMRFCVDEAARALAVVEGPNAQEINAAQEFVARMQKRLDAETAESIINNGMHEFIDTFQSDLNDLGKVIHDTYFAQRSFHAYQSQSQSQSQSSQRQSQS